MIPHRLLDEVDVELVERPQVSDSLGRRPAAVRIQAQARRGAERLADAGNRVEIVEVAEADLEVEDVEARRQPVGDLCLEALTRVARQVVEVRCFGLLQPAEHSPDGLSAGAAADVPQRRVDPRPGEVARPGSELPQPVRERVVTHRIAVPWIATDDERRERS